MKKWIAVDWGTSTFRAYLVQNNEVSDTIETKDGMKFVKSHLFEQTLLTLIDRWLDNDKITEILASGMVGSKQGWEEAPYQKTPCNLKSLNYITPSLKDNRISLKIFSGVCQINQPDVMRGEETQIAGFINKNTNFKGVVCLPGTHAKWVNINEGQITSFKTFMTGELFGVISNHTLIRHSTSIKGWDQESFEEGVHDGFKNPGLIASNLFSLRAESIVNNLDRDQARSTLSGLLLGVELNGAQSYWKGKNVTLIGSELLSNNYHEGLKVLGGESQLFSLETATLSGLSSAYRDLISG